MARNIVFFQVNGASAAEKSRLARALSQASSRVSRIARALELMVPGDFLSSLMMLCLCVLQVLKHFVHSNCCVQRTCSTVACCYSIVFCNSVSADRGGVAASRFRPAAAACVILLRFAPESRQSHCNGSVGREGCFGSSFFR